METGKIHFIHLRRHEIDQATMRPTETPSAKGGMTIAFRFDQDNLTLVVGQPAVCDGNDHYVKSQGRKLSEQRLNLDVSAPAERQPAYISRETYTKMALEDLDQIINKGLAQVFSTQLSSATREEYVKAMTFNPVNTIGARWFESLVVYTVSSRLGVSADSLAYIKN